MSPTCSTTQLRKARVDVGALLGLILGIGLLLVWRSGPRAPQRGDRSYRWGARRQEALRQAGLGAISPLQLLSAQCGFALLVVLVVLLITGTIAIAACFGCFAAAAPVLLVQRLAARRRQMLREVWPEAIDNLASAVRAGMSLPEALAALAENGPESLRAPFEQFGSTYRTNGRFSDCLDQLKSQLADPVGDRVCETLRLAREVGGSDLGAVLRALSEILRMDARTRSELETRQGWTINAARLAVAAPWLVLLLLGTQAGSPGSFDSSGGVLLLGVGAGTCLAAYRIMRRIARLPDEPRVLQ